MSEDSTAEGKYEYVTTENNRQCRLPEQEDDRPTVPMRPRMKEAASDEPVAKEPPKVSPKMSSPNTSRAKSKSVFISEKMLSSPYEIRERSSSSGELGTRIMDFKELSMNYTALQHEVQELRKELRETKELQGKLKGRKDSYECRDD